ncbi:hypothetical protein HWV62_1753 [Athelia sp. TMB]|nr:hypothetical protein HWV62_1753 [Athelia sp. TMB]
MEWRRGGRPPNHILLPGLSSKPTADVSLYPSRDGSRLTRDAPSPTKKRKSKRQRIDPKSLEDDFADWTPGIATEQVDEQEDQTDGTVEGTEPPPSGVVVNVVAVQRRARYLSSDYPMQIWKADHVTEFLREFLRRDGLGEHRHGPVCATCKEPIPLPDTERAVVPMEDVQPPLGVQSPPIFLTRCRDCVAITTTPN